MLPRGSGILLHISSLPSPFGIGDMGPSARLFIDRLSGSGQTYWQLLPLNPTDGVYGHSPYSSPAAFAMNILFISPQDLAEDGLIAKKDIPQLGDLPPERCDYEAALRMKRSVLQTAYAHFRNRPSEGLQKEFHAFCDQQNAWLDDYALFVVLKGVYRDKLWNAWPEEVRKRDPRAIDAVREKHADELEQMKFFQFLFFRQWQALRSYSAQKGVKLIGDIPIYVNFDSSDVWSHPGLFKLDSRLNPRVVAGVPPDYFSQTGQRWGNPVYDWDVMRQNGFAWWKQRFARNLALFDYVRIDHFRGLVDFWQIPAAEKTAVHGQWGQGPKDDFFNALKKDWPDLPIIAEDLGIITQEVTDTMNRFAFPGMKVLLFAFGGETSTHPYIPENYVENCVVYTGTHDNNTTRGWFEHDASGEEKDNLFRYFGRQLTKTQVPWELVQLALRSRANVALIPLQDILELGREARMNIPGQAQGNWLWRCRENQLATKVFGKLRALTEETGRCPVCVK